MGPGGRGESEVLESGSELTQSGISILIIRSDFF